MKNQDYTFMTTLECLQQKTCLNSKEPDPYPKLKSFYLIVETKYLKNIPISEIQEKKI